MHSLNPSLASRGYSINDEASFFAVEVDCLAEPDRRFAGMCLSYGLETLRCVEHIYEVCWQCYGFILFI